MVSLGKEKKEKMKRLNLRKLLLEENRLYNLMSAGYSEWETYRLTFDPLYFEREVLNMPKEENNTEADLTHTTIDTEIEKFKLCSEISKRYSCSLSDLLNISMQIYQGYPFTVAEKRIYLEHGIPFNLLRVEINKLKQTHMETENKNERTYWVIKKMFSVLAYRCEEKSFYTPDFKSAHRFNSLKEAFNEAVFDDIIEKITEPIYKEGDILAANSGNVFIFDKYDNIEDSVYDKAFLWCHGGLNIDDTPTGSFNYISGFATDPQKQRLFDALEKEGKRWNAEKKVVEDIIKPGSVSFTVKLNHESVDRLMRDMDKMREYLLESKNKSEELFKKIQDAANPESSEMAKLKQTLEENYEIESADFTQKRLGYLDETSEKLIVTYKPRRK